MLDADERDPVSLRQAIQELQKNTSRPTFRSEDITGTGVEQSIAHGLNRVPATVILEPATLTGGDFARTWGIHTRDVVKVTVTSGETYAVIAW